MKKFKAIIAVFVCLYIILSIALYVGLRHTSQEMNDEYRVQISRLARDIEDNKVLAAISTKEQQDLTAVLQVDISAYSYADKIYRVAYLDAKSNQADRICTFYTTKNGYQMEVVPVMQEGSVTGYLRFDYKKQADMKSFLFLSEVFLALIFVLSVGILMYTYHKVIRPFHQLSNMPYELSRGNLNDDIGESRNRYFGRFLWGIGMLKDALENHKKRELKLVRDKKLLLLSISHDIKTPLNAIDLYAKALEQNLYETEQERKAAVIRIQEKAAEINDFVKEIIKSSTEEVISIEVNNSEYYLSELVDKVDAGYSQKCSLNQMMFHIGAYENHLLKGDLDRMYEAVGNLIENAFKYGDGKKLELIFTEEDYCILIHVINSGDLVLDSEMPHLFDSFYRGSNTEGKAGNGLGLYICSEIMKKMQGDIYAKQTEAGMEFVLVCPIS